MKGEIGGWQKVNFCADSGTVIYNMKMIRTNFMTTL